MITAKVRSLHSNAVSCCRFWPSRLNIAIENEPFMTEPATTLLAESGSQYEFQGVIARPCKGKRWWQTQAGRCWGSCTSHCCGSRLLFEVIFCTLACICKLSHVLDTVLEQPWDFALRLSLWARQTYAGVF